MGEVDYIEGYGLNSGLTVKVPLLEALAKHFNTQCALKA